MIKNNTRSQLSKLVNVGYLLVFLFSLAACSSGGDDSTSTTTPSVSTISGTAATGIAIEGIVNVYGSSGGSVLNTTIDANGKYTVDVSGLTPPFLICAEPSNSVLASQYSAANGAGTVNVTPLTTLTLFYANGGNAPDGLVTNWPSSSATVIAALADAQAVVNANFVGTFISINPSLNIDFTTYDFFTTPFNIGDVIDQILDLLVVDIGGSSITITVDGNPFVFDENIDTTGIDIGSGGDPVSNNATGSLSISGNGTSLISSTTFSPVSVSLSEIAGFGLAQWFSSSDGYLAPDAVIITVFYDLSTNAIIGIGFQDVTSTEMVGEDTVVRTWSGDVNDAIGTINATFDGTTMTFTGDTLELIDSATDLVVPNEELIMNGSLMVQ